jgi:sulfoxide reductase heme-binding subunit YedZ
MARLGTGTIVGLSALAALAVGLGGMALQGGWTAEGAGAATRLTARWAFPWFIAAFAASSLATVWPGGWRTTLLRRRRAVGLAFAANHGVHLAFILLGVLVFEQTAKPVTVVGGGAAYVLIALMAATSSDAAVRWLGRARWKLLHAVGGWVVLLIFTNSYIGRLAEKPWLAIPSLALIAAALLLRIAAFARTRRRARMA